MVDNSAHRAEVGGLSNVQVLHDFDNAYVSGKYAFKRGIRLILYAVSRKLGFLGRFCKDVYEENYRYTFTLFALDRLLGIDSVFGINDRVEETFPGLRKKLDDAGARTVRHWHVSRDEVHWDPELKVPSSQWWMDQEYARGTRSPKPGEWLVFHCDYPYLLQAYIRCLYELRKGRGLP
jgi:hypothetical protein